MTTLAITLPVRDRATWPPSVGRPERGRTAAIAGAETRRMADGQSQLAAQTDIEIIRECQKGREEAFHVLVERYQRRVLSLGYQMLGNFESARDIAQEAFLRVFKAIDRFDTTKNFYTWIYQIVVNLAIDHLRKERGRRAYGLDDAPEPVDGNDVPDELASRSETRVRVRQTLDRLPAKYRTVLTLRDLQGMGCEEIAEVIGTNSATARWRLHRARQLFKEIWEGKTTRVVEEADAE